MLPINNILEFTCLEHVILKLYMNFHEKRDYTEGI